MRPPLNQSLGTMVSSGWYQDSRAFFRSLGASAMNVCRNCWLLAALCSAYYVSRKDHDRCCRWARHLAVQLLAKRMCMSEFWDSFKDNCGSVHLTQFCLNAWSSDRISDWLPHSLTPPPPNIIPSEQ